MRLPPDEAEALRVLEDEAIEANKTKGKVDHLDAALQLQDELRRLEAGGVVWVGTVRNGAELDGLTKRIKARIKRRKASLPTGVGDGRVIIPAAYSRRADDGSVQLTLWWEMPLEELVSLIEDIDRMAQALTDRGLAMRFGLDLARRHGVDTALAGFAAEGIDISQVAA